VRLFWVIWPTEMQFISSSTTKRQTNI